MKEQQFKNMWEKNNKMKCKIISWVTVRNINPTMENCRDYWCGMYKPYARNKWAGIEYLHAMKDKKQIRRLSNARHTHSVGRQNKKSKRSTYERRRR